MQEAIRLSVENVSKGGGPFGAVIVKDDQIISRGVNSVTDIHDPTAHAEIMAIREASKILGTHDLSDCIIYSSCEPCPMCMGAILWARIQVMYYACSRENAEKFGFNDAEFYIEINKPLQERKIKSVSLMQEEALEAFKKWEENPDKIEY